ncbi:MAG: threonine synthase [Anaerolineales bacterium]|nr:threonine synthase [Anaerolineales bacterium]
MGGFLGYRCSRCNVEYGPHEVTYICPDDGGNLDVVLEYERIRNASSPAEVSASSDYSIWRYLPLLPVQDPGHEGTPLRAVGWTPLFKSDRIASRLGLHDLWLKDDGRNPTASFKDRASAVVLARARSINAEVVVTASTGNAGAALAGMAAAAEMPAVILAPKNAPEAKVAQLLIFGAQVFLVEGSYDDAFDLTLEAAESFGWYCRNTGFNPFTAEGKKTAAFEICEQLSLVDERSHAPSWQVPDALFIPVGDGNIISGIHKGFKDLQTLGWIEQMPRIFGVQSVGSAAIYNAYKNDTEAIEPVRANTLADSISVDFPRDGLRALRAAKETGGAFVAVRDEAILEAMRILAREAGVFAEPAGATAYAGLVEAISNKLVGASDQVVVLITGNGLKDVRAAMQAAGEAIVIDPTLESLRRALS